MTDIVGEVSAASVQAQADQISGTVKSTVAQDKFVFWAGIDGTNNIADNWAYSQDTQSTAIGALKECRFSLSAEVEFYGNQPP